MSDLKSFGRTGEDVVAEAIMERAMHRAVLIVEGRTDYMALEEHVNCTVVALVIADSKNNALKAAQLLDAQEYGREVSVLVDRDHDGDREMGARVIVTSARDLDTELLGCGEALRRICKALTGRSEVRPIDDVRAAITDLAAPPSAILTVVQRKGLPVKASALNLKSIKDIPTTSAKLRALTRQALQKSPDARVEAEELERMAVEEIQHSGPHFDSCQGHYLHAALVLVLPGNRKADDVQRSVWVSLRTHEFLRSPTGQALTRWGDSVSVEILNTREAVTA